MQLTDLCFLTKELSLLMEVLGHPINPVHSDMISNHLNRRYLNQGSLNHIFSSLSIIPILFIPSSNFS